MADAQPSAADVGPPDAASSQDAVANALVCEDDRWNLAPGFKPAFKVDYIADRSGNTLTPFVISSVGTPCATAQHKQDCEAALQSSSQIGRHLATTAGDTVRLWPVSAALELLGFLDTPAEALWWIIQKDYDVPCTTTYSKLPEGVVVKGAIAPPCSVNLEGRSMPKDTFLVRLDGSIVLPPQEGGGTVGCVMPIQ